MNRLLSFLVVLAISVTPVLGQSISPQIGGGIGQGFDGGIGGGGTSGFPISGAVIDEKFTTGQYFPGPITSDLVDTRSTTKFATNASGALSSIAINTLPISNAGLLNEPAVTNSLLQSQVLSSATWTKNTATVGGTTTAPDGTNTAQLFSQAATTAAQYAIQSLSLGNGTFIYSVYYKGSGSNFALEITNSASTAGAAVVFNTATNAVIGNASTGSGVTVSSSGVQQVANGFFRAFAVIATTGGTANLGAWLQNGTGTTWFPSTVGSTSNGVYLWGFQSEPDNSTHLPTSYFPTTTAAATRAADSIQIQRTGIGTLVITYSDNTQQTLFPNPAGNFTIPSNLNETLISRITGFATTAPLRQAVSTTAYPDATAAGATIMSQTVVTAMQRIDSIKIEIPNVFGVGESLTGGTMTATATVNYNNAIVATFTFGGIATGSTSGALLASDEIPVPGGIPAGATFATRMYGTSTNSTFAVKDRFAGLSTTAFGAALTDQTGNTSAITQTASGVQWQPTIIATRHKSRAAVAVGDSICEGTGQSGGGNYAPNSGLIIPVLSPLMPTANFGVPGDSLVNFISSHAARAALVNSYFTSVALQLGINDFNAISGAQGFTDRATIAGYWPTLPTLQTTVTPAGSSTDNFATPTNQTPQRTNRVPFNQSVRALPTFIDLAGPLEFGVDSGLWRSVGDGTVTQATTDTGNPWVGVHPTVYGYGLVWASGNVNPALFQ